MHKSRKCHSPYFILSPFGRCSFINLQGPAGIKDPLVFVEIITSSPLTHGALAGPRDIAHKQVLCSPSQASVHLDVSL